MDLKKLKAAASTACVAAREADVGGPVNWGALRCISAQRCEDDL